MCMPLWVCASWKVCAHAHSDEEQSTPVWIHAALSSPTSLLAKSVCGDNWMSTDKMCLLFLCVHMQVCVCAILERSHTVSLHAYSRSCGNVQLHHMCMLHWITSSTGASLWVMRYWKKNFICLSMNLLMQNCTLIYDHVHDPDVKIIWYATVAEEGKTKAVEKCKWANFSTAFMYIL